MKYKRRAHSIGFAGNVSTNGHLPMLVDNTNQERRKKTDGAGNSIIFVILKRNLEERARRMNAAEFDKSLT
jgi:hypothetical protein